MKTCKLPEHTGCVSLHQPQRQPALLDVDFDSWCGHIAKQ